MAVRTVSVELKMKISDFELAAAKAAAISKELGNEFDHMGTSANKFSTAKPTKEMQNFSRVINASLKDGQTGFQSIQRSIDDTKTHIANLRKEFATTGNASVFGDLKSAQKDLRTLESVFKEIAPIAEKAGTQSGASFGGGFLSAATSPLGGTLVAVLAPALIAGVAAAITAGVGLGIVGVGAAIASQDARVKAAFDPLKADLINVFKASADPMVHPIIDALGSLDLFIKNEKPALTSLFASVAPSVGLIGKGVETLVGDLVPALTKVGHTFTSVLSTKEVQASLNGVSASFANIFTTIGNNPKEVADGLLFLNGVLKGTFGLLSDIFNVVGPVVADLRQLRSVTDEYGASIDASAKKQEAAIKASGDAGTHYVRVSEATVEAAKANGTYADSAKQAADMTAAAGNAAIAAAPDYVALAKLLQATTVNSDTLAASLEAKVFNSMMSSDQATLAWNQSLTNLSVTLTANHGVIDENSKSTVKHRQAAEADTGAILGAVSANQQIYQTMVASGVSSYDAARAYDANTKSLEKQLIKAGLTKDQVHSLIGQYEKVPDNVNTAIAVKGLTDAITNLDTTLRLINHLDGLHATATVTTVYHTKGTPVGGHFSTGISRWGNIYEPAADGLLTHAQVYSPVNPGRFMIAEPSTHGEAFIPKNGDYGRSMSIIKAAAGWYNASVTPNGGGGGSGGGNMTLVVTGGDATGKFAVETLRFAIQARGGDVLQVLSPR